MNHPYEPMVDPITDPATVAAWRVYERESKRAASQYRVMPISRGRALAELWEL